MICTPVSVESAEYCDSAESLKAGLKDLVAIFLDQDVQTYPAYFSAAAGEVTESMAAVRAAAALTMEAAKFPIKLPCILEKNGLNTKLVGGRTWETELTIQIQNTEHNRGVMKNLIGARFSAAVGETEGDMMLLGQSDGVSSGFLCKIKDDGVMEEFGTAFGDEKYIQVTIACRPHKPVTYPYAIAFS